MFSSMSLSSPSIKLTISEETVFLHPMLLNEPSEDPMVNGLITLFVPKARKLTSLVVRLVGQQDIGWYGGAYRPYESFTCLDKSVALLDEGGEGLLLAKGEHTFEFAFVIPSGTTPYERSSHGRVRHFLTAKAKGIANLGGEIESTPEFVYLVVNPGGGGESRPPPALDLKLEGVNEDLGPYTLALQSQHVTVAGLLLLRFSLPAPPPTAIYILSIRVRIRQHFNLTSPLPDNHTQHTYDPRTVFRCDARTPANEGVVDMQDAEGLGIAPTMREGSMAHQQRHASRGPPTTSRTRSAGTGTSTPASRSGSCTPARNTSATAGGSSGIGTDYFSLSSSSSRPQHLHLLQPGSPYRVQHISRLQNDDTLRPSSHEGSEGGIRVRHEIEFEVTYRKDSMLSGTGGAGTPIAEEEAQGLPASEGRGSAKKKEKEKAKEKEREREREKEETKSFTLTRPFKLYSCCCFLDSLVLPVYSLQDPHPDPDFSPPCICSLSLARLIELQGKELLREEGEGGITYALVQKRRDEASPDEEHRGRRGRVDDGVLEVAAEVELRRALEVSLSGLNGRS